jgi:2-aminoadipate transaminase
MPVTTFDWERSCADWVRGLGASQIRKAIDAAGDARLISLAGGVPDASLFPVGRVSEGFAKVMRDKPHQVLQYGSTEGELALREALAERLTRQGMTVEAGQLLITGGSQQGLDLAGKMFLSPGDEVLVESPSYLGALEAFRQYHADCREVPTDADGIQTDALAEILTRDRAGANRIRLLYTMPNFANPSTVTLSAARRQEVVTIAQRFGLPVVEDDAYGELRYEGEHLPSLFELDDMGVVLRLGTLSKVLAPGLRIGWVAAHPRFIAALTHLKERSVLHSPRAAQLVVADLVREGFLDEHVKKLTDAYGERRDAAVAAAMDSFPAEVTWRPPHGGFYLWCVLPSGLDASALLDIGMSCHRVAFVPAAGFHATVPRPETIRVSFSAVSPALVDEGVRRLGAAMREFLGARETPTPGNSRTGQHGASR